MVGAYDPSFAGSVGATYVVVGGEYQSYAGVVIAGITPLPPPVPGSIITGPYCACAGVTTRSPIVTNDANVFEIVIIFILYIIANNKEFVNLYCLGHISFESIT
jgi:hypothetical protein